MKNASPAVSLMCLPLVAALAACGGGGGGGGGGTSQVRPTTPDESVVTTPPAKIISGSSETESIHYKFDTGTQKFTSITADTSDLGIGGKSTVGFDKDGKLVKLVLAPASGPIEFTSFGPSGVTQLLEFAETGDKSHVALVPSEYALQALELGWNYQSFGVWEPGPETGTGTSGALSFGQLTPINDIPTQGSATYKGILGGQYVNDEGVDHVLYSDLRATADFAARTIALSTTTTLILNESSLRTGTPQNVSSTLGLSGTLTIQPGANAFSGPVSTANGLTGSSQGRFYGPDASELGGVGAVQAAGGGVESIQFAYGAKKQ